MIQINILEYILIGVDFILSFQNYCTLTFIFLVMKFLPKIILEFIITCSNDFSPDLFIVTTHILTSTP